MVPASAFAGSVAPGGAAHFLDPGGERRALLRRRRAVRLRLGVVAAREWIGKIHGVQELRRVAIRLEAPQHGGPQRRAVAIAVHEQHRGQVAARRERRAGRGADEDEGGQQAAQGHRGAPGSRLGEA
jgi:hypothetical protein